MNPSGLLLPLYHVKKQTKNRLLSEKSLIILIIFTSVFSLYFIFKNLPSNNHSDEIRNVFIPKLHKYDENLIHGNSILHEKFHENHKVPIQKNVQEILDEIEPIRVDKDTIVKRNFIKNVIIIDNTMR